MSTSRVSKTLNTARVLDDTTPISPGTTSPSPNGLEGHKKMASMSTASVTLSTGSFASLSSSSLKAAKAAMVKNQQRKLYSATGD